MNKIQAALALDSCFSNYQVEFSPTETMEVVKDLRSVGNATPARLADLIARVNEIMPRTAKGRTFHRFRIGWDAPFVHEDDESETLINFGFCRVVMVVFIPNDLPESEYRVSSRLTSRAMKRLFKYATHSDLSGDGSERTEISYFWPSLNGGRPGPKHRLTRDAP